jgi:hypothetical protein
VQSSAKKAFFKTKDSESLNDLSKTSVLKFHFAGNEESREPAKVNSKKLTIKEDKNAGELKRKKYSSKNYFGVKNHIDLFEVGRFYTNLQNEKIKSLAFYGDKTTYSVQHSILGIASFFNYHKNLKATVFVDRFEGTELAKLLKPTHVEIELLNQENEEDSYEVLVCDGIDIIELSKLKHLAYKIGADAFNDFLKQIVKNADVVFWELPETTKIDVERELYLPILNVIDSLTLVIDTGTTKIDEITEINKFAGKYQIRIEGILLYSKN